MAQQQAMLLETISAMKKAIARNDDASESDEYISRPTNRGNKLKRKAKFVHEGRLTQADGPRSYKRRVPYNEYTRYVISRNPPRVDPDGDVIDDEQESDPDLSPAEDDPYEGIKLESLLMPLTSAAGLHKHPSLSVPYKSKNLEEMVANAQELAHREQASLYRMKQLLVQFRGDNSWAGCGIYEGENDAALLRETRHTIATPGPVETKNEPEPPVIANWETMSNVRLVADLENAVDGTAVKHDSMPNEQKADDTAMARSSSVVDDLASVTTHVRTSADGIQQARGLDVPMQDIHPPIDPTSTSRNYTQQTQSGEAAMTEDTAAITDDPYHMADASSSQDRLQGTISSKTKAPSADSNQGGETPGQNPRGLAPTTDTQDHAMNGIVHNDDEDDDENDDTSQPHRMTTRARAQAPISGTATAPPTPTSIPSDYVPPIHPFFIPPSSSLPIISSTLPAPLADEVRRTLSTYTQKQEEVVRQADSLLQGLRRALKLKREVWRWCRNEGHVGEMSDGEDWIDHEEWGLEEPLRKGEEVEDEEVGVSIGKKTRNRRAVA